MTYKRKYISKKNKLVPGRLLITEKNPSKERKIRHIRMSDEEWNFATENARKCHKFTSTYIRELAAGYRPMVPDPELKHQLSKIRIDIVNFAKHLNGLSDGDRSILLRDPNTHSIWAKSVKDELDFIDDLMRRT